MKKTYIMGLNCAYHESSVCIFENGKVISFIEEERLNRVKHAKSADIDNSDVLPLLAIDYCLKEAGVTIADISHIGYNMNPRARLEKNLNHKHPYVPTPGDFGTKEGEELFYAKNLNVETKMRDMGFTGGFHFLYHHDCHAAGAYFSSGYTSAAVLVIDGISEFESTTLYKANGTKLERIQSLDFPHSLGFLWEKFSKFLGFNYTDASKVMGLTSYGNPAIYREAFKKLIEVHQDGTFTIDDNIVQFRKEDYSKLENLFGIEKYVGKMTSVDGANQKYADLAATLQEITEEIIQRLARTLAEKTNEHSLCMAGGVALNCVANGKLIEQNIFKNIYIQPQANDAGGAIGAAFLVATQILKQKKPKALKHAYLGPKFSNKEILFALKDSGLVYKKMKSTEKHTAQLLASGKLVAWFEGRAETGPRALGHRSLLADPRNKECFEIINAKVKLRERFRPLCPSFLEEEIGNWIDIGEENGIPDPAKYMLAAFQAKTGKKAIIPAVVHVDNTSRVQTVSKKTSPRYWKLIKEFKKITGVPALMNTSFNIQEPIVSSPEDAISTFLKSQIDYLVMENYICERETSI